MSEASLHIALTTVANRSDAETLATTLLERKLAACVNILGPIHSLYHWQGAIERADEFLLIIKTSTASLDALEQAVLQLHPYDTPEFLALEAVAASEAYAAWLLSSLA